MSDLFQSVPFAVVLLIIGFVFLVKGADAFVEGCSSIARRYHVPSLIIGMTIVAMGTRDEPSGDCGQCDGSSYGKQCTCS